MNTLNIRSKLLALVSIAVIVTVWATSGMSANPSQDESAQNARISPQVREAADEVGVVVQGGLTHGQTLRFDVFRLAAKAPGPPQFDLSFFDSQGGLLAHTILFGQNQNGDIQSSFFDLNADTLPPNAFDSTGRVEFTGVLRAKTPGPPECFAAAAEVFDISTGRTLYHIAATPLSGCATGHH
jgi:hypothetical protein